MFKEPQFVVGAESSRSPDPLGLQTANMNRYQSVFPGLNNRARYIRIYSAICWMVLQIRASLEHDAPDEEIQAAFDAGLQKIQLLLVWANSKWCVPAMPGSKRVFPKDDELGVLTYTSMRSSGAPDTEDDLSTTKPGVTLLAAVEYSPSITNGLVFLRRHRYLRDVFDLTEGGKALADQFEPMVQMLPAKKQRWFRDIFANTIRWSEVEGLREVLRLDTPTQEECAAFVKQFYPDDSRATSADCRRRCRGLSLALRALEAEEADRDPSDPYVSTSNIRHAMARGFTAKGRPVNVEALESTQRTWQVLQIYQYLKLALETLLRASEWEIHHAIIRPYETDVETRTVVARHRDIDTIANRIGKAAQEGVGESQTVGDLLDIIRQEKGNATSLYLAGTQSPKLDIEQNFNDLFKLSRFRIVDESISNNVSAAVLALLWCACEADAIKQEGFEGDRLTLAELKRLADMYRHKPVQEFMSHIVRDFVINQHFDVVRERTEDDIAANRSPKDRYRINVAEGGLELPYSAAVQLSRTAVMADVLQHALYLSAQCGYVEIKPDGGRRTAAFRLTKTGRQRAAQAPASLEFEELMGLSLEQAAA